MTLQGKELAARDAAFAKEVPPHSVRARVPCARAGTRSRARGLDCVQMYLCGSEQVPGGSPSLLFYCMQAEKVNETKTPAAVASELNERLVAVEERLDKVRCRTLIANG